MASRHLCGVVVVHHREDRGVGPAPLVVTRLRRAGAGHAAVARRRHRLCIAASLSTSPSTSTRTQVTGLRGSPQTWQHQSFWQARRRRPWVSRHHGCPAVTGLGREPGDPPRQAAASPVRTLPGRCRDLLGAAGPARRRSVCQPRSTGGSCIPTARRERSQPRTPPPHDGHENHGCGSSHHHSVVVATGWLIEPAGGVHHRGRRRRSTGQTVR